MTSRWSLAGCAFGTVCVMAMWFTAAQAQTPCVGDCDGKEDVTVNEIITLVNIALGNGDLSACPSGTGTEVTIVVIIQAVNNALEGCDGVTPPVPTNTPTPAAPTSSPTPTPVLGGHSFTYEFIASALTRSSASFLAEAKAEGARGFAYMEGDCFGNLCAESGTLYIRGE